jgi:small subunit ribosomal protein S20
LAHSKSAKKSIRIYAEKRSRNRSVKGALKTALGKAEQSILDGESEPAREAVLQATIALDRAAKKGIIHSNNAARHKSRLVKRLNSTFPAEG